tara:strand:+ start:22 stop:477 length:456 start_codon:yes stop_codon:yes gene_type:complete
MSQFIQVREMELRDGLQLIKTLLPTRTKQEWLTRQIDAGFEEIEISSMVPKKILPQFSDAVDMINYSNNIPNHIGCVLVPNLHGAELAFKAKAKKMIFVMSASEAHNRANVKMSVNTSLNTLENIILTKTQVLQPKKLKLLAQFQLLLGVQ